MAIEPLIPAGARQVTYEDGGSVFKIWFLRNGLVVTYLNGYGHLSFSKHLDELDVEIAKGVPLRIFHDWENAHDYDSQVRAIFTDWTRKNRKAIRSITLLTRSSIVAMGVATGSMLLAAVGLHMRHFRQRDRFEEAVIRAQKETLV